MKTNGYTGGRWNGIAAWPNNVVIIVCTNKWMIGEENPSRLNSLIATYSNRCQSWMLSSKNLSKIIKNNKIML